MYKNSVDCAVCLGAFGVYYDAFSWIKCKDSQHKLIPSVIFFSESASVDFDCPSFDKILAHFFVYFVCVCFLVSISVSLSFSHCRQSNLPSKSGRFPRSDVYLVLKSHR